MKLNHKLIMVSAAALMSVSPLAGTVQNVQAATAKSSSTTTAKKTTSTSKKSTSSKSTKATTTKTSTKKTSSKSTSSTTKKTTTSTAKKTTSTKKASSNSIKLVHNAYVYDKNGKRLTTYMGSPKNTTIAKGVTVKSNGKVEIKGVSYYNLGGGAYIKAVNVDGPSASTTNKKKPSSSDSTVTAVSIKIAHNSYVYDENGKRIKKYEGKTKLTKGTTVDSYGTDTINGKLYYQLNEKGTAFVKAANVDTTESVTITLKKNAYIYNENGDTKKKKIKKGKSVKATEARYIGTKLYYKIGDNQFVKAANVGKVSGELDPINEPDGDATVDDPNTDNVNPDVTTVTTIGVTPLYNIKGQKDDSRSFGAGQSQQVSELRYIATSANSTPDLFYKLASGRGYLKASDVTVSGKTLTPVNTPDQAKADVTVATAADKTKLSESINQSKNVKDSTTYKLSSYSLKGEYDKAVSDATAVNNNASATIAQVNEAVANINAAYAKLNGQKVTVANLNSITLDESNQIVKLVASVRNVPESDVQFTNNNTTLQIVSSNGYRETLNVSDYAQQR